jgi:hypothetical protein
LIWIDPVPLEVGVDTLQKSLYITVEEMLDSGLDVGLEELQIVIEEEEDQEKAV